MKKYMFLMAAAATMLASCSSDEKVDAPENVSNAITFNAFAYNSSRGTGVENEVTTANMSQFMLYGYDETTKTMIINTMASNNNGAVTYNPLVYWIKGHDYKFFGIGATPGMKGLTEPSFDYLANGFEWPAIPFNNNTAVGDDDVVTATAEALQSQEWNTNVNGFQCPAPVKLVFKHIMTRIQLAFNTQGSRTQDGTQLNNDPIAYPYNVVVSDVTYNAGMTQVADFTPALGTAAPGIWGAPTDQANYVQNYTDFTYTNPAAEGEITSGVSEAHYFVPFANGSFTFTASIMQNGVAQVTKTFTCPVTYDSFLMGHSYKLNVNLGRGNFDMNCPISFVVEVEDWIQEEQKDYEWPLPND